MTNIKNNEAAEKPRAARAEDIDGQLWVSRADVPVSHYANVVQVRVTNLDAEIHFGQIYAISETGKGIVEAVTVTVPVVLLRQLGDLIQQQLARIEAQFGEIQAPFANVNTDGTLKASAVSSATEVPQ